MSKKGNGLDYGVSNVLDGDYTIYQGNSGSALNHGFRYRPSGGPNMMPGTNGFGRDFTDYGPINNQNSFQGTKQQNQNSSIEKTSPAKNDKEETPDRGIMHLFSVYADKSSLNGVVFIKSSKYLVVKAIWTLLILISITAMVIHLYMLGSTYYSYEKQSKVDLKFENLKFPAITFCNVNAMRLSKMHLARSDLQWLIEEVDPDVMYKNVDAWEPSYMEETYMFDENGEPVGSGWGSGWDSGSGSGWGSGSGSGSGSGDTSWERKKRKKRSTVSATHESSSNITVMSRTNSFFDDYSYNWSSIDSYINNEYSGDTYSGSWESESEPSAFEHIAEQFISMYNKENGTTRQTMGHRIQDMLIQCAFVGRKCVQSNFSMVASSTMGNCYTIQYNKFIARKSGPREGLTLMLNLETEEYIPGITNSKGAKLVVHEPGTVPFPDDEGMAIGAGMETSIGLRRTSISRLHKPHGECTSLYAFRTKYGIKYTRQACQEICEMEEILSKCRCYNSLKPFIFTLLRNRDDLKPCQIEKDNLYCMEDVMWDFQINSTCHCSSPCQEVTYRKTISSKPWPSTAFAKLMAKSVCKEKPGNYLCEYSTMDNVTLRDNFVKVNVYFETLNYESVSEEPDYTEFQFASDIGGTIGLYIGISALSAFELLHLFIAILRHLFCGRRNNNNN